MSAKDYLIFTKRERAGILGLICILLSIAIAPRLFPRNRPELPPLPDSLIAKPFPEQRIASHADRPYKTSMHWPVKKRRSLSPKKVNINSADTTAWIALPGIGSKLAARIVLFREKLGGFYSVEQVGEVYGLKDSVFQRLRNFLVCDTGAVRLLDINLADGDQLSRHPYIRWKLAGMLVEYRAQHGRFTSINDLSNIEQFDYETLRKLKPYLRCG